jgi:methionine--tRNA ligase beta chain
MFMSYTMERWYICELCHQVWNKLQGRNTPNHTTEAPVVPPLQHVPFLLLQVSMEILSHAIATVIRCEGYIMCLQCARVLEVEPVEGSDKLWLCQVDCGEEKPRQIVAGLQQFVPRDVMLGLDVVTICNLKVAKLAGQTSEAMILAASCMDGETRIVKTLKPPDGASPGDKVRALQERLVWSRAV